LALAVYARLRGVDDNGASCSPRCLAALDIAVVAESEDTSALLELLLPHFTFGDSESRFGFVDAASGNVEAAFTSSRASYRAAMRSWSPSSGEKVPVDTAVKRAQILLPNARSGVSTAVLFVNQEALDIDFMPTVGATNITNSTVPDQHIAVRVPRKGNDLSAAVAALLPQVCPALKIDPSMPCGPSRWGAQTNESSVGEETWGSFL